MGSKVFAFGDIAGPVQFGKPAVLKKGHPPGAHRASGLRIGLAAVPLLSRHPAQPFEGNAGRQHGHRQDGHQRHVDTGMGQRIGRGRLASPATTPVFAPGLAEDEPSPDVPSGTVPGLFCSLPPGAVLFGLGCVTIALRAVHQKGRQPLRAWSLYASFSLPVSLMLLCDLLMLPRYMSEAVSVAVFTMLAGAACLIGPGNMSPSASSSPSSAL